MKIITWNVQWCRGIDGNVDPGRILRTARDLADFDVLCLQEIPVNFGGLAGSHGEDQVQALAMALPGFQAHFGAGTDVDDGNGGRRLFGNLILSRLPVLQVYRHLLPWPADATVSSMQRVAVEAVVRAGSGDLRIVTTHLEYYSRTQRMAQIEGLRRLHAEACAHALWGRKAGETGGPFEAQPRPASAIFCGDFNLNPQDPGYERITAPFDDRVPRLFDAWPIAHPDVPHAPTVGIHENSFSPQPECFDFMLLTPDLANRIEAVEIDGVTQASDHQPVLLDLRD